MMAFCRHQWNVNGMPSEYPPELGLIVGCQSASNDIASGYALHFDGRLNTDGQAAPIGHIHFQIGCYW